VFGALFFASIGMLLNPIFLLKQIDEILALVVFILVVKGLVLCAAVYGAGLPLRSAVNIGVELAHVGEFAFVLASEGLNFNVLQQDYYLNVLGATAISVLITPFIFALVSLFSQGPKTPRPGAPRSLSAGSSVALNVT
jgi:CPA2 family monovalent cation:H+ antiporter-2